MTTSFDIVKKRLVMYGIRTTIDNYGFLTCEHPLITFYGVIDEATPGELLQYVVDKPNFIITNPESLEIGWIGEIPKDTSSFVQQDLPKRWSGLNG